MKWPQVFNPSPYDWSYTGTGTMIILTRVIFIIKAICGFQTSIAKNQARKDTVDYTECKYDYFPMQNRVKLRGWR